MGYCTVEEVKSSGAFSNDLQQWFADAVDVDAAIQAEIDIWAGYMDGYLTDYETVPIPSSWPFYGTLKAWNIQLVVCSLRQKSSAIEPDGDPCEMIHKQLQKILNGNMNIAPNDTEDDKAGVRLHSSGGKFPEGIL